MNAQPPALSDSEFEWRGQRRDIGAVLRVVGAFVPVAPGFIQAYAEIAARVTEERLSALEHELHRIDLDTKGMRAALSDPVRGEVIQRAVEAAAHSRQREKLRLLAGIIAASPRVDIDEAHLMLWLVERMETVHLAVMSVLAKARSAQVGVTFANVRGGWAQVELAERLPNLSLYLPMCIAWLSANGLIKDVAAGNYDWTPDAAKWSLTELGERLMRFVHPGDENDPEST